MEKSPFDDVTDVYEAMIDWPKRLAHEALFYRRWFEKLGVRSVVDVACGAGHHAAMFHSWGLCVEGADLSAAMIERARASFGEPPGLRWVIRGFQQPIAPAEPFDAALCVGNSLALSADRAGAEKAIREMLAALRSGGLLVVHLLNLWHLLDGPCVWQKFQRSTLPQGEVLIVKGVHRCGRRGYIELIVVPLAAPAQSRHESAPLLGFEAHDLEVMAQAAGAARIQFFGGYRDQAFDSQQSADLVLVAEKS